MKKVIFIISAMVLTATSYSQTTANTDKRNLTYYGLKFGVNYSDIYDAKSQGESFNATPKVGIAFGASLTLPLSPLFGLQSEMLLSEKGFKATGVSGGNSYELTRTSTYLDMPLYFTVKPSNMLTILAGTRYSYLIDQTDKFKQSSSSTIQKETFKNENTNRGSFSVGGGLDVNINSFVISGRANWDLTNNRLDEPNVVSPLYKNMWYQLTVGFRFL